jgi:hypothetical protein
MALEFEGGYNRVMKFKSMLFAALVAAGALSGCGGGAHTMSSSPAVPAAQGQVKFEKAANDNTGIDLTVKHMADPQKLTPPAQHYVVWTRQNKDAAPQNIGALSVDKNLTGTLKTVTPLHGFELFVTAEGSGQVQQPTGEPLLWTDYSR